MLEEKVFYDEKNFEFFCPLHVEFSAEHNGKFDDENCLDNKKHMHKKWRVKLWLVSNDLNHERVMANFGEIERFVKEKFEGTYINELKEFKDTVATCEEIARYLNKAIPECIRVRIAESSDRFQLTVQKEKRDA